MNESYCRVCNSQNLEKIFNYKGEYTFTSSQVPTSINELDVRLCLNCSHVQSRVIDNIERYYDTGYNFHLSDDQTDDLYATHNGVTIYRSDHQLEQLIKKVDFTTPKRVLDYGCGKASTLKKLAEKQAQVEPYVFDVSASYTKFWDSFVAISNQATHQLPDDWSDKFDVVLSYFALEHVTSPTDFVLQLFKLLRTGGVVHLLVPNMYQNMNDILVVDHINHFSTASLSNLFYNAGFEEVTIDEQAHNAALTLTAVRPVKQTTNSGAIPTNTTDVVHHCEDARSIADACSKMFINIKEIEHAIQGKKTAIYGSGIYGMMTLVSLSDRSNISVFLEQNKFRQGGNFLGVPIVSPGELPMDVECIIAGLNPKYARQIISSMNFLTSSGQTIYYL